MATTKQLAAQWTGQPGGTHVMQTGYGGKALWIVPAARGRFKAGFYNDITIFEAPDIDAAKKKALAWALTVAEKERASASEKDDANERSLWAGVVKFFKGIAP